MQVKEVREWDSEMVDKKDWISVPSYSEVTHITTYFNSFDVACYLKEISPYSLIKK